MPKHDIIVIGASVGGLEALKMLVSSLPPDLPAALLIVWHMSSESLGLLRGCLSGAGHCLQPTPAMVK